MNRGKIARSQRFLNNALMQRGVRGRQQFFLAAVSGICLGGVWLKGGFRQPSLATVGEGY